MHYLFVYGTLAPGRSNEHILAGLDGEWTAASVRGTLYKEGWGAAQGYPGIVLDDVESVVDGFVFASNDLPAHWQRLDDFEGNEYKRVTTEVQLVSNDSVTAHVYVLNRD